MVGGECCGCASKTLKRLQKQLKGLPHVLDPIPLTLPFIDEHGQVVDDVPKYDLLYLDPPWFYYGDPNKMGAAGKEYKLMQPEEINALPIKSLLAKKAAVFLWVTCPKLHFGLDAIRSWGLHYRGVAFIWAKTRQDGELIGAQGVPPTFTKPTVEMILAATTMPRGRPWKLQTSKMRQVVPCPREREHSKKPAIFRQNIEELAGPKPTKLEMFCRGRPAPGWHGWGDECQPAKPVSFRELVKGTVE